MRPIILTILDGWGYSPQRHGNAILYAQTPFVDFVQRNYPSLLLQASGRAVGMTWGEAGNSEVGHLTLGAGRTIFQYLSRINKAIGDGNFYSNEALLGAVNHAKENYSTLHIAGLLTSGSVHAHISHLFALIDLAAKNNFANIRIHLFTDGKDSRIKEAPILIQKVLNHATKTGIGTITTVMGRDYAMDRNKNWDSTRKAYELLVRGAGEKTDDILQKLETNYQMGYSDSNLPPMITDKQGLVKDGDALIFFNFREDSMRQITRSFIEDDFHIFPVEKFSNLFVVAMTQYLEDSHLKVAFPVPEIKNGLAEILSLNGKTQLHIAESEKYAHATYFFNCLKNVPYSGETDIFIESLKDHAINPEMRAAEISEKITDYLNQNLYDFYIINFANPDVLAHTGNLESTIRGVEAIDGALRRVANTVLDKGGVMIITADHGNAESMVYESSGEKKSRHEESPVPLYLIGKQFQRDREIEEVEKSLSQVNGILSDVAPTILELMEIPKPEEMTGESLLRYLAE
ncbi:MAG: phosphoglycerate mutase (2,3-diphosphoglycerate-independent) [Candidatus Yanofskybacteria bacterium RIFCSPHIGHO2_01_FULL_43_42]|uniref:2,3-bisphosphoglycerate-independent phosphoglycerate mutase n=1 Tax=Candidatus Yanofskybacteria bacterium RIFCSPLOWO2_01_FULL_43_22 TaxID=1802695 RepID=A0A1F8GF50_9BACT|nr:MAG: phosphoglycerate mutase (2,3-diphosphoglycerate-independent) [Candidatus Yanofskybacteria bacterium RIFCSPHIGHO2_01_FULL_43_42]OGN13501.1 MAG: phosphoglycerate mutase (2,3-diphosphoglycerate-independent) [Candidatus Yanofskybacteria bacterium RIFCSPHIGHO2_02_FULL_43_17]OGN23356.1 MAG: phosphoglycerate mutase (2,3-diphosphoglycerate-independent) [Candidatus Yanofskybacteria bacterium RIFCSPLOWO2_01_FULL_43_22]